MPSTRPPAATPEQLAFERLGFGVSFHFGLGTFTGREFDEGTTPPVTYAPSALDVEQWIGAAAAGGARYAVLTAKHMSGFCLWRTATSRHSVAHAGERTDVVEAFVGACARQGLLAGLYYCILDPHNEGKLDWHGPVDAPYFALVEAQVEELLSRHAGAIGYLIFDIPWKLDDAQRAALYARVKAHDPRLLVNMNQGTGHSQAHQGRRVRPGSWPVDVLNLEETLPPEGGHDPILEVDGALHYLPLEAWTFSGARRADGTSSWFWHPAYKTEPPPALQAQRAATRQRRANLLLNFAPDVTGRLPADAVAALEALGRGDNAG